MYIQNHDAEITRTPYSGITSIQIRSRYCGSVMGSLSLEMVQIVGYL